MLLANRAQSTSWKKTKTLPLLADANVHTGEQREVAENKYGHGGGKSTVNQERGSCFMLHLAEETEALNCLHGQGSSSQRRMHI